MIIQKIIKKKKCYVLNVKNINRCIILITIGLKKKEIIITGLLCVTNAKPGERGVQNEEEFYLYLRT